MSAGPDKPRGKKPDVAAVTGRLREATFAVWQANVRGVHTLLAGDVVCFGADRLELAAA